MKINITEEATRELQNMTKANGRIPKLTTAGSRCMIGTPNLTLEFVKLKENDKVVTFNDIQLTYNEELESFVKQAEIDYQQEGLKRGFNITVID